MNPSITRNMDSKLGAEDTQPVLPYAGDVSPLPSVQQLKSSSRLLTEPHASDTPFADLSGAAGRGTDASSHAQTHHAYRPLIQSHDDISVDELKNILLSGVWFLRFPSVLESIYRSYVRTRALKIFRLNGLVGAILYGALGWGIYTQMPVTSHSGWLTIWGIGVTMMVVSRALSFFHFFDRWFNWYVTANSVVVVALSVLVNNYVPMGAGAALSYVSMSYMMFFVYCFVGLRFPHAVLAGWLGGAVGIALTYDLGSAIDWSMLHGTYTAASFLGMIMAYGLDRHNRISFLQSYLLQQTLNKSEQQAREDHLTGLANRRYLNETLGHEWNRMLRHQQSLVIMMVDIDYFKRYNDAVGHQAGDHCLQQIAQVLASLAHRSGEMAARYGGEEFVLLFPGMDIDAAKDQAQRLMDKMAALALPHPDPDIENSVVTLSIGIAVCVPKSSMTVDLLLRQADTALYKAKAHGRNRFEFFRV